MCRYITISAVLCLLAACSYSKGRYERAVVSVDTYQKGNWREYVQDKITPFFNGRKILLAQNVFVDTPDLIIERANKDSVTGNLLNGAQLSLHDGVDTFTLVKKNTKCYIRHNQSEKHVFLNGIKCSKELLKK